jgi:hypothetical protein
VALAFVPQDTAPVTLLRRINTRSPAPPLRPVPLTTAAMVSAVPGGGAEARRPVLQREAGNLIFPFDKGIKKKFQSGRGHLYLDTFPECPPLHQRR